MNLSSNFSYLDENFEEQTFNRGNNQRKGYSLSSFVLHLWGYVQRVYFGYHKRLFCVLLRFSNNWSAYRTFNTQLSQYLISTGSYNLYPTMWDVFTLTFFGIFNANDPYNISVYLSVWRQPFCKRVHIYIYIYILAQTYTSSKILWGDS